MRTPRQIRAERELRRNMGELIRAIQAEATRLNSYDRTMIELADPTGATVAALDRARREMFTLVDPTVIAALRLHLEAFDQPRSREYVADWLTRGANAMTSAHQIESRAFEARVTDVVERIRDSADLGL